MYESIDRENGHFLTGKLKLNFTILLLRSNSIRKIMKNYPIEELIDRVESNGSNPFETV